MRILPREPEIGDYDGFDPNKDIFGRKSIGDGLTYLFTHVEDPIVVALDAQWGAGKTTFLKMWAGQLRNLGFPVVYFDAFANDYSDDAFTSVTSHIIDLVQTRRKLRTSAAKRFVARATSASKIILRSGLRLGVKLATLSAVDTKGFEAAAEAMASEISELSDKYVGELLTRQKDRQTTFEAFRESLSELPALLAEGAYELRPLVFIVDELDRCRPTFALELLEKIKHFFSVNNVHFVLGAHLRQLQNSVVAAYGSEIDARTYLEKFIHVTVNLTDQGRYRP